MRKLWIPAKGNAVAFKEVQSRTEIVPVITFLLFKRETPEQNMKKAPLPDLGKKTAFHLKAFTPTSFLLPYKETNIE